MTLPRTLFILALHVAPWGFMYQAVTSDPPDWGVAVICAFFVYVLNVIGEVSL